MGLLDSPMMQMGMGLLAASGPSRTPVSLGQALASAYGQTQEAQQQHSARQQRDQIFDMQKQKYMMELAQQQKAQAEQEAAKQGLQQYIQSLPDTDPKKGQIVQALQMGVPMKEVWDKLNPKIEPYTLGPGQQRRGPNNEVLASVPVTPDVKNGYLVPDGAGGWKIDPVLYKAKLGEQRAGATNVKTVVNPALDPFKNEKALRDEYTSLPQVKAATEMNAAFKLIDTASKMPSAANDLAMATKFMKILDPTSVVRESELALALNATGLLDKVYNYANMIKTGQKLNPAQRKDFHQSAKAINDAMQADIAPIAARYKGIAGQYGLTPENITFSTEFENGSSGGAGGWSARVVK